MGFMLGSSCSPCCSQQPCQPCPNCAPLCLTATFSGFAHGTDNCGECDFLDDTTFVLRRPPDPTLSVTASVPSATGSGATFSVTTTRNATDGSYAVTGIKLTNGGANYSPGDAMTFASNGCIVEPPESSITIATTRPVATSLRMTPAVVPSGMAITGVPVTYEQQADEDGNPYWRVASIGSPFFGVGYAEGMAVSLTPGIPSGSSNRESGVIIPEAATARITQTNRVAPTLEVRITRAGGGTFDAQTVSLSQDTDANGREVWFVSGVAVGWWFPSNFTAADTVSFLTVGTTATAAQSATATLTVNESGAITGFTVTNGGQYYDTQGRPLAVELLTAGRYYKPGVITAVTLNDGGKIFGPNSCTYRSDTVCAVCPTGDAFGDGLNKRELYVTATIGAGEHSLTLWLRDWYQYGISPPAYSDTAILSASQSSVDGDGAPIPCDGFVFDAESVTEGCSTNGTITLASADCESESVRYCDSAGNMPEQITLSLSGMGLLFLWSSRNGGAPGSPPTPMSDECGIQYDILIRGTGVATGPSGYGGDLVVQDFEVVLDRDDNNSCFWSWSGFAPSPPTEGIIAGNVSVDCGGDLGVPVSVSIGPVGLEATVFISPPTMAEGETATAEAVVSSLEDGGEITGVTLLTPGSGYAREVFERVEPAMTVSLSGGTGSGAVLSATLTQDGEGESATWYISDVTVTDGGTGHNGLESVAFTPEEGTTVDWPASAVVLVGRTEPTIAAGVSGGSGADLSVTLGVSTDWFTGQDYWYVASVAVDDGGTGYADGAGVTFTVTDGVESYEASATIVTGREEPEVTASLPYSSGSGAVLTPVLSAYGSSWTVASITIDDGGSGYSQWEQVAISTDDVEESGSYFYVSSVDGSGAITGIGSYGGGSYYRSNGIIESVSVSSGGSYYKSNGIIESVLLSDGGSYYLAESTGTSEVDVPTVSFRSYSGTDATATATVDGTLGSPTFGQITGVTVTNAGQNYRPSGTGWALSISIGTLTHLEVLLGNETPPNPNEADAVDCANFWDKNQPFANRVSFEACPADLLSRSYVMSAGSFSLPFGDPYGDGMANAVWCRTPAPSWGGAPSATFYEFGNGEITCTISPA